MTHEKRMCYNINRNYFHLQKMELKRYRKSLKKNKKIKHLVRVTVCLLGLFLNLALPTLHFLEVAANSPSQRTKLFQSNTPVFVLSSCYLNHTLEQSSGEDNHHDRQNCTFCQILSSIHSFFITPFVTVSFLNKSFFKPSHSAQIPHSFFASALTSRGPPIYQSFL